MKTRNFEVTLERAKQWYIEGGELKDIALQLYSEKELGLVRIRSWEEFCEKYPIKKGEFYVDSDSVIRRAIHKGREKRNDFDKNLCTSKEEAEAICSLIELLQLRKVWVGDWKPNWKERFPSKWVIVCYNDEVVVDCDELLSCPLSFPKEEMAMDFFKTFRKLLETAKPLL